MHNYINSHLKMFEGSVSLLPLLASICLSNKFDCVVTRVVLLLKALQNMINLGLHLHYDNGII